MSGLVERIKSYQKAKGLTDKEMAEKIGYARANWNSIKNGKYPLNEKFLVAVGRAIPELQLEICKELFKEE